MERCISPVPVEMRLRRVRVVATLETLDEDAPTGEPAAVQQETSGAKPITAMISTPNGMKPDFAEIRRQVFGDDPRSMLTEEDSAFIRDRGDR
ncbi:MAG: hypothetical protein ACAI35_13760 [Candidatus Methylacidiphilales bacterium]